MLSRLYAKWMYAWETTLTTRDTNRIVRPLEWGFDWLQDFSPLAAGCPTACPERAEGSGSSDVGSPAPQFSQATQVDYARMIAINADIVARTKLGWNEKAAWDGLAEYYADRFDITPR